MDASLRWHDELRLLHVSALRLDPDTVRTLERLGLKTIGALIECRGWRWRGDSGAAKTWSMRSTGCSAASRSR